VKGKAEDMIETNEKKTRGKENPRRDERLDGSAKARRTLRLNGRRYGKKKSVHRESQEKSGWCGVWGGGDTSADSNKLLKTIGTGSQSRQSRRGRAVEEGHAHIGGELDRLLEPGRKRGCWAVGDHKKKRKH